MQFPNRETELLWRSRLVGVNDLLSGKVDLSVVPFRYVTICPGGLGIGQGPVLQAVEWLEQFDWGTRPTPTTTTASASPPSCAESAAPPPPRRTPQPRTDHSSVRPALLPKDDI